MAVIEKKFCFSHKQAKSGVAEVAHFFLSDNKHIEASSVGSSKFVFLNLWQVTIHCASYMFQRKLLVFWRSCPTLQSLFIPVFLSHKVRGEVRPSRWVFQRIWRASLASLTQWCAFVFEFAVINPLIRSHQWSEQNRHIVRSKIAIHSHKVFVT